MTAMAQSHGIVDDDLELAALSPTEWRVTNRHVALDDARSLVAFVEKVGNGYELMRFGDPIEFGRFASLDAVLGHLAGHVASAGSAAGRTVARVTDLASVRRSHLAQEK
ncbi:hypothetical protein [Cryobacterium tepidiphilum]|nr:hypothetical protein [Cryobacterium tepidiphilum]